MTIQSTIVNAEPYADLRVRCCMDWSKQLTALNLHQ
jgi:hypothetical protein